MNILITGSGGFVGSHLSSSIGEKHKVFKIISSKGFPHHKNEISVDLRDKEEVISRFIVFKESYKIDTIIHLASCLASIQNINNLSILHNNLKITETIVHLCKLLKPKKLINFSSIAVYPNSDGVYSESSNVKPSENTDCLYGLSKFCGENILSFMLRNEDVIISHLRLAQVYGEGMRSDRIISVMKQELAENNSITVFGDGERVSNFIHINRLVEIVGLVIEKPLNGIYNVGDEKMSYFELAQRVIEEYGNEKSIIIKKKQGSRSKFIFDTSKLQRAIES